MIMIKSNHTFENVKFFVKLSTILEAKESGLVVGPLNAYT